MNYPRRIGYMIKVRHEGIATRRTTTRTFDKSKIPLLMATWNCIAALGQNSSLSVNQNWNQLVMPRNKLCV